MDAEAAKDLVRRGYDALSARYDEVYEGETKYEVWIQELLDDLDEGSRVLDLGCGSGVPLAKALVDAGRQVVGVDISEMQVQRARELVPRGEFLQADATKLDLPAGSFDAVVSFYALIHIPLDEQAPLLRRIAGWLRPGGRFVATTGSRAWTGAEENWLDGDVPMWWSHADTATYRGVARAERAGGRAGGVRAGGRRRAHAVLGSPGVNARLWGWSCGSWSTSWRWRTSGA